MDAKTKIEQLRWIATAAPSDYLALYMLGLELTRDDQHEEAAEVLARCVAIKPDYTAAYRHWGDALRRAGRHEEAASVYERGIAVSEQTGDLQAGKEMRVFLEKLQK
jgi:tetratricopeptide (TPR) repeat protein